MSTPPRFVSGIELLDETDKLRGFLGEIENWVDRYIGTYGPKITHQHAIMEIAKVLERWRKSNL